MRKKVDSLGRGKMGLLYVEKYGNSPLGVKECDGLVDAFHYHFLILFSGLINSISMV